jgi:hypothetical protein
MEVERRLAAYLPVETDPQVDLEMQRIIRSGMRGDAPLPFVPPPPALRADDASPGRRTRMRSRRA